MEIRKGSINSEISKVETDQRAEVSKIKPIGSNQIPDSFEKGNSSSTERQSSSSASAEPDKKAGQITGGILIKQMTQARLAEPGKKVSESGKKELSETQQEQADSVNPKVNTDKKSRIDLPGSSTSQGSRIPDGSFSGDARTNLNKNQQAVRDFLAEHNIETPSSGIDPSHFKVGNGITADDLKGGPTGPGNPMDGLNDKLAAMNYAKNLGASNVLTELQNAANSDEVNRRDTGKDQIADGGDLKKINNPEHEGKTTKTYTEGNQIITVETTRYRDKLDGTMKEQRVTTTKYVPTTRDVDPENYQDPEAEKMRKQMDEMAKNLGLPGIWDLPKGPKDKGDGPDPGPEGAPTGISKDESPSMLSQFGKDGLVGQPNQQREGGSFGDANFHGLPGDTVTDPQDGDPYHGARRNEDVDVSVRTGMKEQADEDREKKSTIQPEFKAGPKLPGPQKF
jgi:hypothetical protein